MKKFFNYLLLCVFALFVFSSCEKDEPELYPSALVKGAYIINYGSYDKGGSSISRYDYEKGELTNFFDQQQNKGAEFASNIQYAYKTGDHIFLTGNSPDQLISLDPLMVQAKNGVSDQIVKPRSCVADGKYLYVSCWGGDIWTDQSLSYIAKYNIETGVVEKKIALAGGPEGLEIANGKLYAALNYKKAVAVIDLSTEAISYIETPAVCSYFLKDNSGNLYVSLISSYSVAATQTGLGYINTSTNELAAVYELDNVSTEYASIMAFSKDKSKIFVVAAAYDENWMLVGGVKVFDVAAKTFATSSLVSGISGLKGLSANPADGNIYVFVAPSATTNGLMKIYSEAGQAIAEKEVGASPTMAIFLN